MKRRKGRKDWDYNHAPLIQIRPSKKSSYGPTNGPTDGKSLLQRCVDASKKNISDLVIQLGFLISPDSNQQSFMQLQNSVVSSTTRNIKSLVAMRAFRCTTQIYKESRTLFNIQVNELEDPIIASRIRINPIRWNHHISMRVEIKGCIFNAYTATFTGNHLSSTVSFPSVRMPTRSFIEWAISAFPDS